MVEEDGGGRREKSSGLQDNRRIGGTGMGTDTATVAGSETVWGKRTRLLHKMVGISLKLGELYSDSTLRRTELAHLNVLAAVTTALVESRRRVAEGTHPGEGDWLSGDEIGASLESKLPFPSPLSRHRDTGFEGTRTLLALGTSVERSRLTTLTYRPRP